MNHVEASQNTFSFIITEEGAGRNLNSVKSTLSTAM
uniref:Uncharacterized protein n=1 Tax=Anguilla anguilla TaxID=7936 RepID=A0A0E9VRX2_ANGAN